MKTTREKVVDLANKMDCGVDFSTERTLRVSIEAPKGHNFGGPHELVNFAGEDEPSEVAWKGALDDLTEWKRIGLDICGEDCEWWTDDRQKAVNYIRGLKAPKGGTK